MKEGSAIPMYLFSIDIFFLAEYFQSYYLQVNNDDDDDDDDGDNIFNELICRSTMGEFSARSPKLPLTTC